MKVTRFIRTQKVVRTPSPCIYHYVSDPLKPDPTKPCVWSGLDAYFWRVLKGEKSAGSWGIKIVITTNPIRFDKAILPEGIHVDLFQLKTKILIDSIFKMIRIVKS